MTGRQEIIRRAVIKARRDWLEYTIKQERKIYALFADAADRIQARIHRYAKAGKIPPDRLVAILGSQHEPHPDSVRGVLQQLRPKLRGEVKKSMTQSVTFGMKTQIHGLVAANPGPWLKVGIGTSFIAKDGKIRTYDVTKQLYGQSAWAKINSDAMDHLIRTQYAGITLSDRVWDISWDTEKQIRGRINSSILIGEDVNTVARDVRPYLVRPDDRFNRIRRDGKLVLSKPARAFRPGRGVYRSAFRNAQRLARTEMARAYHEGTVRYTKQKKWLDGNIWRLGGAVPCAVCIDLNGRFFAKGSEPGLQHPNCMCWLETHIDGDPMPEEKEPLSDVTKKSILTSY